MKPMSKNTGPMSSADYAELIRGAAVYEVASKTPLDLARNLSLRLDNRILMKREDLQSVFSFKLRGAYNKLTTLPQEILEAGIICSSAGNHAQGVALAAQRKGVRAVVVMPITTPSIKIEAVKSLGAEVVMHGDTYDDAYLHARKLETEQDLTFIHAFDDPDVIAGQGTIGKEILEQTDEKISAVFVPIGGGGLISGIAAYIKGVNPDIRIIGVEPEDSAAMRDSLAAGKPIVLDHVGIFADGVAVRRVGDETFRLCQELVDDIVTVGDTAILHALRTVMERMKIVIEPSAAVPLAAILDDRFDVQGLRVGIILSGGNVDLNRLPR